jgi:Protein of unknown function (DUF2510)
MQPDRVVASSHEPPTHLPPASWYPDPEGTGLRWWNGSAWSHHRHPSPELRTLEQPTVLRCTACNQRRDYRVSYCPNCGERESAADPDTPLTGGGWYVTDDVSSYSGVGRIDERYIAIIQQAALREGRTPPPEATARQQAEARREHIRQEHRDRMDQAALERLQTGPYSTGNWEANPHGLSGRMIRGYRHWRRKR